jgi:sec-independent protein translocase protein TatB
MFDFAWSEIGLIAVVALVLIGPKDMPVAIKAVAGMVKKARRMASEFQTHVDEMVRDTELADVRRQINEIRNFDIRGEIERAVDSDGSLRQSFADPLITPAPTTPVAASDVPAPGDVSGEMSGEAINLPGPAEGAADAPAEASGDAAAAAPAGSSDIEPPADEIEAPPVFDDLAFLPPAVTAVIEAPAFIPPRSARPQAPRELPL